MDTREVFYIDFILVVMILPNGASDVLQVGLS